MRLKLVFMSSVPLTLTAVESVIPDCSVTATNSAMCRLRLMATAEPPNQMTEKGSCGMSRVVRGLETHQKVIYH